VRCNEAALHLASPQPLFISGCPAKLNITVLYDVVNFTLATVGSGPAHALSAMKALKAALQILEFN
jgi:ATP-dependent protease HslVU (ClpYQ) peptidase subunit